MAESPVDNNDIMTSFSNPNYAMMDADALNSNLPATEYYDNGNEDDDVNLYEEVITGKDTSSATDNHSENGGYGNGTSKSRTKYAQMDLSAMGIGLTGGGSGGGQRSAMAGDGGGDSDGDATLKSKNGSLINTPDSLGSYDSDSAYSTITSPSEEKTGSIVQVEHNENDDDDTEDDETPYAESRPKGFLGYYASLEQSAKSRSSSQGAGTKTEKDDGRKTDAGSESDDSKSSKDNRSFEEKAKDINSPDSNDSGIQADVHVQHHHGPLNEDIYAVVDKKSKKSKDKQHGQDATSADKESSQDRLQEDGDLAEVLPPGWEKHQDEDGPYYWHIKSGTIQRDPPPPPPPDRNYGKPLSPKQTQDSASPAVSSPPEKDNAPKDKERHNAFNKGKDEGEASSEEFPIRFAVRSLGWVRIAEEDLTPEKSSKAVNKCIVDLSLGRNDINDVVGRWGDGKDLYMDLDEENLSLIDPQDVTILNLQPIQSIRVWGVGRDNGRERDFAYVARDRTSRKHMCHVFRCDTPARQIANTLRDICQKIMLERSLQQAGAGAPGVGSGGGRAGGINRPNNLPNLERFDQMDGQKITFESLFNNTSFPTPMEEPKKVIRCHYLGTLQVVKSTGERNLSVDILNNAMEKMYHRVPPEKWTFVSVAIAPSTITITEHAKPDNILAECRVRFLAFMGIAMKNVKLCSFIMHTAQDQFVAHVFHCEPSAGALCKTIEAACKLRYQKCLDAHAKQNPSLGKDGQHQSKPVEPSAPPVPPVSVAAAAADASQPGLASKLSTTLKSTVHNSNAKLTTLKSSVQHAVQFVKKKASANKS